MKQLFFFISLTLVIATGCKQKASDAGTDSTAAREEMIAGDVQKTWKAQREENAAGDKERLDRSERQERIIFYRNHNVTMTSNTESSQGKWSLDGNTLALQMDGSGDTRMTFEIVTLDKNDFDLRAADGSVMKLKPE